MLDEYGGCRVSEMHLNIKNRAPDSAWLTSALSWTRIWLSPVHGRTRRANFPKSFDNLSVIYSVTLLFIRDVPTLCQRRPWNRRSTRACIPPRTSHAFFWSWRCYRSPSQTFTLCLRIIQNTLCPPAINCLIISRPNCICCNTSCDTFRYAPLCYSVDSWEQFRHIFF